MKHKAKFHPKGKLLGHDKSGTRGARSRYAITYCDKHGRDHSTLGKGVVSVPIPETKAELTAGCPICRKLNHA